jgi:TolB-like protein/DNA-binding winged helix-turn-helix (wHTH) protein
MTGTDSSIRIGAWRVDPAREQISKDGSTIKLERRLMQLLLCLAEHPGQILSVEQLLDTVWAGVVVTPDSVYHTVASLRRVLGDDKKTPTYITNIPRRGYSLIAPVAPWVESIAPAVDVTLEQAKDTPVSRAAAPTRFSFRPGAVASFTVLMLALGYAAIQQRWFKPEVETTLTSPPVIPAAKTAGASVPAKSIAVLPFEDLSEHKDQQYFADGMAEEIIDRLVQVPDLRVPGRTSSFYFKGKAATLTDIASALGVANVLEGSVRTSGDRIRVIARLVRVNDGYQVWSQNYDRQLRDIFAVQDEIAAAITTALQISMSGMPLSAERGGTKNIEAYRLYLRARSLFSMDGTAASIGRSQDSLKQAVKIDPDFGLAWALLAAQSVALVDTGNLAPIVGYDQAQHLAEHAIEISPEIGQAHAGLAYVYRTRDWNWGASKKELQLAFQADPTDSLILMMDGLLSKTLGDHARAERQLRAAVDRDPFFTYANFHLGNTLYLAGQFEEAETVLRHVVEISPQFWSRPYLSKTLLAQGKAQDALIVIGQADEKDRADLLPIILYANSRASDSEAALKVLIAKHSATDAYYIGMTYAYRREKQLALQWLERAYAQRDPGLLDMIGEPLLNNILAEPRYHAILRAMKLPQ